MNSDVTDFASLAPAYPELLLAVGTVVLLLVGVFINKERSLLVSYASVLLLLVVGALAFDLDIGLLAVTVGVVLSLVAPRGAKGAVGQIAWPTVLLICGIVTYVGLMQDQDVPGWLGENVAQLGVPLLAALLICYIGGVVSAFASNVAAASGF